LGLLGRETSEWEIRKKEVQGPAATERGNKIKRGFVDLQMVIKIKGSQSDPPRAIYSMKKRGGLSRVKNKNRGRAYTRSNAWGRRGPGHAAGWIPNQNSGTGAYSQKERDARSEGKDLGKGPDFAG